MVLEAREDNCKQVDVVSVDGDRILVKLIAEEAERGLDAYQRGDGRGNAAAISLARIDAMIHMINRIYQEQQYLANGGIEDDF